MKRDFVVVIDFDGTIVEHKYPDIGDLLPGAKEAINHFLKSEIQVIIWTVRAGLDQAFAQRFLDENEIGYTTINENTPSVLKWLGLDTRKVFGNIYIDDRNIGGLPEWDKIKEEVMDQFYLSIN